MLVLAFVHYIPECISDLHILIYHFRNYSRRISTSRMYLKGKAVYFVWQTRKDSHDGNCLNRRQVKREILEEVSFIAF